MIATVGRFLDPWEAYVIRARLESEGIPATMAYAHHAVANWPFSLALGGTAVQVPSSHLSHALSILDDYRSGSLEKDLLDELGLDPEHCSVCGSLEYSRTMHAKERALALVLGVFTSFMFPTSLSKLVCANCGNQWTANGG